MNQYLSDFLAGVQSPAASGFEHLNTLLVRDHLFEARSTLTAEEQAMLLKADYLLFKQATAFLAELEMMTSLAYERQAREAPPEQWWWYLDVIEHLPFLEQLSTPAAYYGKGGGLSLIRTILDEP